jgi:16S rRNA (guanine(1405)-N(7))-methyltransferase
MTDEKSDLRPLMDEILSSKKYRDLDLSESTLRDLLEQELPRFRSRKDALDAVRSKLHNIVAPYLGDPNYTAAAAEFDAAFASGNSEQVRAVCEQILEAHASTHERMSILNEFYERIFAFTGQPGTILDLACGLNPFAFPWMGLPSSTRYYAYDIHRPRVDLINHYFRLQGLEPLATHQDILVDPPQVEADAAFFFKEAHRFEQRQRGSSLKMWRALNVRYLLVSLPTSSLNGRHNLIERQRALVYGALEGETWPVTELAFESEMVFCIEKKDCATAADDRG